MVYDYMVDVVDIYLRERQSATTTTKVSLADNQNFVKKKRKKKKGSNGQIIVLRRRTAALCGFSRDFKNGQNSFVTRLVPVCAVDC